MYPSTSIDFWSALDAEVLRCLAERRGEMTPGEIGRNLGISEHAVCSIIGMLAETGKVRICAVEGIAQAAVQERRRRH
jgi:predicted transcriptional regulator